PLYSRSSRVCASAQLALRVPGTSDPRPSRRSLQLVKIVDLKQKAHTARLVPDTHSRCPLQLVKIVDLKQKAHTARLVRFRHSCCLGRRVTGEMTMMPQTAQIN